MFYDQTLQFKSIVTELSEKYPRSKPDSVQKEDSGTLSFKKYLEASRDVYHSISLAICMILDSFPDYCLLTRNSIKEHQRQNESYSSTLATQRLERSQVLLSLETRLDSLNDHYESLINKTVTLPTFSIFKSDKGTKSIPIDLLAFGEGCLQSLNQRFSALSTLAVKIETIRKERELVLNKFSIWSSKFVVQPKNPPPHQQRSIYTETTVQDQPNYEPIVDSQILEQEAKQLFQSSMLTFQSSELSALEEAVKSVQSIGELQNILSLHIESQSHTITTLYDDAILSYDHVKRGHDYLKRASSDPQGAFRLASMFLLVLTFAIIFLDWFD